VSQAQTPVLARQRYAELVCERASIGSTRPLSERLFAAFAEVPREHYLGPGPWKISRPSDPWTKVETSDANPERIYDDVLVSIVAEKNLANGLPSGHARWLNALDLQLGEHAVHCGCGTGYYTAIIAHVVGATGRVTAIELDQSLASRAARNLSEFSNVEVIAGDATTYSAGEVDAIYVNAGATHPMPLWLDSLKPHGRLIFPMVRFPSGSETWISNAGAGKRDFEAGMGLMLRIQRTAAAYASEVVSPAAFFPCFGAIDPEPEADRQFVEALQSGAIAQANSLRREPHDQVASCLLHIHGYCFSRLATE
jgi:protein-L-isoaspartate(D-aspartate) O-methyltransferase